MDRMTEKPSHIHRAYTAATGTLSTALWRVRIGTAALFLGRHAIVAHSDALDALAALHAVGGGQKRLEQAVALEMLGVPDAEVEALIIRYHQEPL